MIYIPMIDALQFSFDILDYPSPVSELLATLAEKKEQAKELSANKLSQKVAIEIGNQVFEVLPNGANGFAYILHNNFYQIKLAQYRSSNDNFYPVKVSIKAEALWSLSPESSYQLIYQFVNEQIGTITANKISRIDLCCHTNAIDFPATMPDMYKGNFRANNIRTYNRKVSGFEFGNRASKVYCRIYDKKLEVNQTQKKQWFFDIWRKKGWYYDDRMWNIEFELKRDFFSTYQIESVEEAFASLSNIWHHLMDAWLVLTNNDRSRIENATINAEWLHIATLFDDYEGKPLVKREEQETADAAALIPALNGYARKIAALQNTRDIDSAFESLKSEVEWYNTRKGTTFDESIAETQRLLRGGDL